MRHGLTKKVNDEFYTPPEMAAKFVEVALPLIRGRRVMCPCDDFRVSSITAALFAAEQRGLIMGLDCSSFAPETLFDEEGGLHVVTEGGKVVLSESVSIDMFSRSYGEHVVVTNPPFSQLRNFVQKLLNAGADFCLIAPLTFLTTQIFAKNAGRRLFATMPMKRYSFIRPNQPPKAIGAVVVSSKRLREPGAQPSRLSEFRFYDGTDIAVAEKITALPDYDGLIGVPVTFGVDTPDGWEIEGSKGGLFLNNRNVFKRLIVKKKR